MARRAGSRPLAERRRPDGATGARSDPTHVAGHSRATLSRMPRASSISRLADDQRRQDAQHIVAGGQARADPRRAVSRRNRRPSRLAADAEQQPGAAQFGEQLRVGRDQRLELPAQQPRDRVRRRSKKPGSSITSSTALPAATAIGLPPKVEPWVPGDHADGRLSRWPGRRRSGSRFRAPWRPP